MGCHEHGAEEQTFGYEERQPGDAQRLTPFNSYEKSNACDES